MAPGEVALAMLLSENGFGVRLDEADLTVRRRLGAVGEVAGLAGWRRPEDLNRRRAR